MKKKINKKKLIGSILFGIVFVTLAILVGILLVGKITNQVFFIGNYTVLWVRTGSMEPAIPEQSYILVKKADVSKIQVGDVITFYSDDPKLEGSLNTHRVYEIVGDHEEFKTQGDAGPKDEYTAKAEKVVGVYADRNLPVLTAVERFLLSTYGFISILVFLAVLTVILYIPDMKKAIRKAAEAAESPAENNVQTPGGNQDVSQVETEKNDQDLQK